MLAMDVIDYANLASLSNVKVDTAVKTPVVPDNAMDESMNSQGNFTIFFNIG